MEKIKRKTQSVWRQICVSGIILIAILATGQVLEAKSLDPDADKILQSMSSYPTISRKVSSIHEDIRNR